MSLNLVKQNTLDLGALSFEAFKNTRRNWFFLLLFYKVIGSGEVWTLDVFVENTRRNCLPMTFSVV